MGRARSRGAKTKGTVGSVQPAKERESSKGSTLPGIGAAALAVLLVAVLCLASTWWDADPDPLEARGAHTRSPQLHVVNRTEGPQRWWDIKCSKRQRRVGGCSHDRRCGRFVVDTLFTQSELKQLRAMAEKCESASTLHTKLAKQRCGCCSSRCQPWRICRDGPRWCSWRADHPGPSLWSVVIQRQVR